MKKEAKILEHTLQNIHNKEPFHVQIPPQNKLVFNKIVPYLFVYRADEPKDPMLNELVKSEYAYLKVQNPAFDIPFWIPPISQKLANEFGACLIVEAWSAPEEQEHDIEINIYRKNILSIAEYLQKSIREDAPRLSTTLKTRTHITTHQGRATLIDLKDKQNSQVFYIGLSVRASYLQGQQAKVLPIVLRQMRETLSKSLSKTFFEFVRIHTNCKPTSFKIVRQDELSPLVWEIDKKLAQESQRFDFLLLVTPINTHEAWLEFKKDNYRKAPHFHYRPMPIDPDMVKRNLYNLPIEELYDPTIAYLFRDKRKELDAMMSMLSERGREGFMHGSLQVFGNVSEKLLDKAKAILTIIENPTTKQKKEEDYVDAEEFAQFAQREIDDLHRQNPKFDTTVRIRDDISGVMVNQGVLNISKQYSLPRKRVNALIQHEVGTHIVTYFNGKQQPFNVFKLGVPGYEELQEGLAVLSEYLVDGLNNDRLRIIAARVVAVDHMLGGNRFIDTFSMLTEQYGFSEMSAFQITTRVYRSGGLTKDALYLKGLIELVNYVKEGNDLKLLTMGKIREDYIPIIEDLTMKGILKPPALTPKYLQSPHIERLDLLKKGTGIFKMIQ